uniref:Phosphoglucosamine mutase n=1 Tax=Candidatus Kentrum sp. FM TaxID=2126340 RepID=A0A450TSA6_9GAMM|nr:MAG: phosphoglucosamine mutase [Candidatus Kentron sp. FM]VFJ71550.1 MAG: phosphoglucosamine mutase [Candidatus Kentron sp. FM]VFK18917.1 MAG: phosphoglucosamine mutase [Candidatus Kentron sp. FM]
MAQKRQYFGTDGIRGEVGKPPITPEFILKLGWAAGRVLAARGGGGKILIGKDTRISGYMFESALQSGLSAAGVNIRLLGPMPTPAIAYLTQTLHAQAGIVISASHNRFTDNGIKFFAGDGSKLPDGVELAIEAELERPMQTVAPHHLGKARRVTDAPGRYIEFCKSSLPFGMNLTGLKIVVDCGHGATYHVAPNVFRELGAQVIEVGTEPDGFNINEGCGATATECLRDTVLEHQADVGAAFDGDGDRVIMVDHTGERVDGDDLLYIIACSRQEQGRLRGNTVVGTVMSNLGLERALARHGIQLVRADVGDRYVLEYLGKGGWTLGGETSGHIICLDRASTGDGIVSALQVLSALDQFGRTLHDFKRDITKYPQILRNVPMPRRIDVTTLPEVQASIHAAQASLAETGGRVSLRLSGTEPLVRIMVEGREKAQVERLVSDIATTVKSALKHEV